MALLLNIDTATSYASVCISNNKEIIAFADSASQKDHAAFLHVAINSLVQQAAITLNNIDAVAVTSGPGSYTGLRVGMASAKGVCYALGKPLICINTLDVMAQAALTHKDIPITEYVCPMIDARRLEVFTAIYDRQQASDNDTLTAVLSPCAMVLEPGVFDVFLQKGSILFFGDGSEKSKQIIHDANSRFAELQHSAVNLAALAIKSFEANQFADLAYAEPVYIKEFYSTAKTGNK